MGGKPLPNFICNHCKESYHPRRRQYNQFCSRRCYNEYRKEQTQSRTEKQCSQCGTSKPLVSFSKDRTTYDGLRSNCRDCAVNSQRDYDLRRLYGITSAEYDKMYLAQDGLCEICSTPMIDARDACVDHNHKTGAVRGLLCGGCNRGLGQFGENIVNLKLAIEYLRKHGAV